MLPQMSVLQRITRQVNFAFLRRNFSTSGSVQMIPKNKAENETPETKREVQDKTKLIRNPIVAAAFQNLNADGGMKKDGPIPTSSFDDKIINCTTAKGLLTLSEVDGITRKHALKIVSILAEWSSIGKTKLSDFESDPRFIRLCRLLGRTSNKSVKPFEPKKEDFPSKYKTEDLNTVLSVTGEDEAAKLIANITLPQMVKILGSLAQKKRRSTPLLRSLAFNISGSPETLDLKQCGDILYAIAVLSFPDSLLLHRICTEVQRELPKNKNRSAAVGSILTSLGLLRFRDVDTLESLSEWILMHREDCRPQDISALFLTLANLNFTPSNMDQLKSAVIQNLTAQDAQSSSEWLNLVWSLVVLDCATAAQVDSILRPVFIDALEQERTLTPTIKMKLLNINAAANFLFRDYKGMKLSDGHPIFDLELQHSKEKQIIFNGMMDALKSLLNSESYVNVYKNSKMGFLIDAECQLDSKCLPVAVNKTCKDGKKIAIMVHDFKDMCQGSHQTLNGIQILAIKLLEKSGYHVLTVPYNEISISDKLLKRVQYLETKLKAIVSAK